jgi:5-methylcytosine-specific restriction protein A
MAARPKSICRKVACGALLDTPGYCAKHRKAIQQADRIERGTAHERGYTSAWAKARAGHLRNSPLCVHCAAEGRTVAASVVDHMIPHKGDMVAFWVSSNWQSLCKRHHDIKTATEDGGFGHSRKKNPEKNPEKNNC